MRRPAGGTPTLPGTAKVARLHSELNRFRRLLKKGRPHLLLVLFNPFEQEQEHDKEQEIRSVPRDLIPSLRNNRT